MTNRALITASIIAAHAIGGAAFAQSSAVGPAPGVPAPEIQSGSTNAEGRNNETRSERDARNELGAKRATGDQLGPPSGLAPSEEQVRRMLEKQGYSNIQNLRQQGDTYTGSAMKGSKPVQLHIDAQRGRVDEIGG